MSIDLTKYNQLFLGEFFGVGLYPRGDGIGHICFDVIKNFGD